MNMSDFTVIDDDMISMENFGYNYGAEVYAISKDDIQALLNGKMLATNINAEEYSIFIRLLKEEEK